MFDCINSTMKFINFWSYFNDWRVESLKFYRNDLPTFQKFIKFNFCNKEYFTVFRNNGSNLCLHIDFATHILYIEYEIHCISNVSYRRVILRYCSYITSEAATRAQRKLGSVCILKSFCNIANGSRCRKG